jgi:hypothetical protein
MYPGQMLSTNKELKKAIWQIRVFPWTQLAVKEYPNVTTAFFFLQFR